MAKPPAMAAHKGPKYEGAMGMKYESTATMEAMMMMTSARLILTSF